VAKLAGISQKQMSQSEPGKRPGVQAGTIANIAQVLPVSTDDLVGLTAAEDGGCTGRDCCDKDRRVVFCTWR
jgi:transcriptional regulator with XRE-family HTH domain